MLMVFGCKRTLGKPCVIAELIRPNCDVYELDKYQLFGRMDASSDDSATLSFLSGDIPSEFLQCCTQIRVRVDWPECGLYNYQLLDGVLIGERRDRVLEFASDSIEWEIGSLTSAIEATVIAYPEGSPEAFKSMTAIEAAYQYLSENLQTNVMPRGDGSTCAVRELDCIEIEPPTVEQIANSQPWEGDRHGENLLDTVEKALSVDGLNLLSTIEEGSGDCCYVCRYSFGTRGTERTTVLSPCLDNAEITRLVTRCDNYDVVHVFGDVDDGAGNVSQQIVTACATDEPQGKCTRETSIKLTEVTTLAAMTTAGQEFLNSQPPNEVVTFRTVWNCALKPLIDLSIGDTVQLIDENDTQRTVKVSQMPFLVVDDELVQIGATFEVLT